MVGVDHVVAQLELDELDLAVELDARESSSINLLVDVSGEWLSVLLLFQPVAPGVDGRALFKSAGSDPRG